MPHYKGAIFDLDGTLLNSLDDIADAANAALQKNGYPSHPIDSYRYFIGDGLQVLIERIIPRYENNQNIVDLLKEDFKFFYENDWHKKSKLYDGIQSMIDALWGKGIKLAVCSNKPHLFSQRIVDHFFLAHTFVCVYGNKKQLPQKPNPTGALLIASEFNLNVNEIVFIGDSAIDIKTGKNAEMTTLGVEWGFRERSELVSNGADKIVQHPCEIINFIVTNV